MPYLRQYYPMDAVRPVRRVGVLPVPAPAAGGLPAGVQAVTRQGCRCAAADLAARVEALERLTAIMAQHLVDRPLPCWLPGCRAMALPLPRPRGSDCPFYQTCLSEAADLRAAAERR